MHFLQATTLLAGLCSCVLAAGLHHSSQQSTSLNRTSPFPSIASVSIPKNISNVRITFSTTKPSPTSSISAASVARSYSSRQPVPLLTLTDIALQTQLVHPLPNKIAANTPPPTSQCNHAGTRLAALWRTIPQDGHLAQLNSLQWLLSSSRYFPHDSLYTLGGMAACQDVRCHDHQSKVLQ